MGWISAVGVFQHFHRELVYAPSPTGAGLDSGSEWRRDAPRPVWLKDNHGKWHQVYVDDFDMSETFPIEEAERLEGSVAQEHQAVRKAYQRAGVTWEPDKSCLLYTSPSPRD